MNNIAASMFSAQKSILRGSVPLAPCILYQTLNLLDFYLPFEITCIARGLLVYFFDKTNIVSWTLKPLYA